MTTTAEMQTAVETSHVFDRCGCSLAADHRGKETEDQARRWHDRLTAIDDPRPFEAMAMVLCSLTDEELPYNFGFDMFFAQHQWRDQIGAYWLADTLDTLAAMVKEHAFVWNLRQGRTLDLPGGHKYEPILKGLRLTLGGSRTA